MKNKGIITTEFRIAFTFRLEGVGVGIEHMALKRHQKKKKALKYRMGQ